MSDAPKQEEPDDPWKVAADELCKYAEEQEGRAKQAEASLLVLRAQVAKQGLIIQRVQALAGELEAADSGSNAADYRLARFVVSEIRAIVGTPEVTPDA